MSLDRFRGNSFHGLFSYLVFFIFGFPLTYQLFSSGTFYTGINSVLFLFLGFFCALRIGTNSITKDFNALDASFFIYITYCVLNSLLKSPGQGFGINQMFLLGTCGYYICVKGANSALVSINVITLFLLFAGTIVQIWAYLQYFNILPSSPFYPATSFFFNPNILCIYLTFLSPLALYKFLNESNKSLKYWALFFIANTIIINVMLLCRSAIIALAISTVYLILKIGKKQMPFIKVFCIFFIASFILIFFAFKQKSSSTDGRMLILKVSATMLKASPYTGIGFGHFKSKYNLSQAEYFGKGNFKKNEVVLSDENYSPNNEFLNLLIEGGIIGLSLFFILILNIFLSKPTEGGLENTSIIYFINCSLLCLLITAVFSYPFSEPSIFYSFVSLISIISAIRKSNISIPVNKYLIRGVLSIICVACFYSFFYLNKWIRLKDQPITSKTLEKYSDLSAYLSNNPDFLYDYGLKLIEMKKPQFAIESLEKAQLLLPSTSIISTLGKLYHSLKMKKRAEEKFRLATFILPGKFIPKYNLLNFYLDNHDNVNAVITAKKILATPIKVPSVEVDIIRAEAQKTINSFNLHR